jgi:protein O-mannosyl-transferase
MLQTIFGEKGEGVMSGKTPPNDLGKAPLLAVSAVLVVLTIFVYAQVAHFQFLTYDDYNYVTGNPHVARGITASGIIWAFTSFDASNWHPVTWLSHMADVQLFGMNPGAHHITNAVIHSLSSLLLLFLLLRITGSLWKSSVVAALFALHPAHVESVAWVAERKDVLSAFFCFLTLYFYAEYGTKRKPALYLLTLISFVIGLMSKPMLVTLPVLMLLLDFWPLRRWTGEGEGDAPAASRLANSLTLVKEKIPFFVCSLGSGILTICAQSKGGAVKDLARISFGHRVENAIVSYVKYVGKMLWPHDMAILYPTVPSFPLWEVAGSVLVIGFATTAAYRWRNSYPFVTLGWFWFLITLLPVIGLIQVGEQAMADRYTYIPAIGLFVIAAWGFAELTSRWQQRKRVAALVAALVITASTVKTWNQIHYWNNDQSVFQHALDTTTGNYTAHYNLGYALSKQGDLDGAINHYQEALRLQPNLYETHNNLALVLARKGDVDAAIAEYRAALLLQPNMPQAHNSLGFALATKGDIDAATAEFLEALRLKPDYAAAHANLAFAHLNKGAVDAAIREFEEAVRLEPDQTKGYYGLGVALAGRGDLDAAAASFRKALAIDPDDQAVQSQLIALERKRQTLGAK